MSPIDEDIEEIARRLGHIERAYDDRATRFQNSVDAGFALAVAVGKYLEVPHSSEAARNLREAQYEYMGHHSGNFHTVTE